MTNAINTNNIDNNMDAVADGIIDALLDQGLKAARAVAVPAAAPVLARRAKVTWAGSTPAAVEVVPATDAVALGALGDVRGRVAKYAQQGYGVEAPHPALAYALAAVAVMSRHETAIRQTAVACNMAGVAAPTLASQGGTLVLSVAGFIRRLEDLAEAVATYYATAPAWAKDLAMEVFSMAVLAALDLNDRALRAKCPEPVEASTVAALLMAAAHMPGVACTPELANLTRIRGWQGLPQQPKLGAAPAPVLATLRAIWAKTWASKDAAAFAHARLAAGEPDEGSVSLTGGFRLRLTGALREKLGRRARTMPAARPGLVATPGRTSDSRMDHEVHQVLADNRQWAKVLARTDNSPMALGCRHG